jgi:hypothetical protein
LAYWTASTILVLSVILVFFGILGPLMAQVDLDHNSIFAAFSIMIGSVIVLVAIEKPVFLVKRILQKDSDENSRASGRMGFTILGLAFWMGGLLYMLTGEIESLVVSPVLGAIIGYLGAVFRGR